MAFGNIEYTKEELFAVLQLTTTEVIDFVAVDIPDAAATALAEAYLDIVVARTALDWPVGRTLRKFANEQVPVIKAAIAAVVVP